MRNEAGPYTRRDALMTIGQLGLLIACSDSDASNELANTGGELTGGAPPPSPAAGSCIQTFAQDEGPFFVEQRPMRSDLTAGSSNIAAMDGIPLDVNFTVYAVRGTACTPLEGVQVDIWSADTAGLYSGLCIQGTEGDDSLRGYQFTDADGVVQFRTVFPGWYQGRTIHFHVKLRLASGSTQLLDFTTQLYVADDITDRVMAAPPYNSRGARSTTNATDALFAALPDQEGTPIRLPANACDPAPGGGMIGLGGGGGPPPGIGNGPPPVVSDDSMGPRLLLDIQEKSDGSGFSGNFSFGVTMP